jgi:hypothetical protein
MFAASRPRYRLWAMYKKKCMCRNSIPDSVARRIDTGLLYPASALAEAA